MFHPDTPLEDSFMNKKELAVRLAQEAGLTQVQAMKVLNVLFDSRKGHGIIAGELEGGKKVTIPGFGTFQTKERAKRTGTNPSTQKKIEIPSRVFPYFKAGKTLKERIVK